MSAASCSGARSTNSVEPLRTIMPLGMLLSERSVPSAMPARSAASPKRMVLGTTQAV